MVLTGNEGVDEILDRFTIVDKSRLNYLAKIFHDYVPSDNDPYLSHQVEQHSPGRCLSSTWALLEVRLDSF